LPLSPGLSPAPWLSRRKLTAASHHDRECLYPLSSFESHSALVAVLRSNGASNLCRVQTLRFCGALWTWLWTTLILVCPNPRSCVNGEASITIANGLLRRQPWANSGAEALSDVRIAMATRAGITDALTNAEVRLGQS
jgi:hypothetical protein